MVMGCYGIGITRVMAAAVEQSFDENGIIWHPSIAPYDVEVIPVNVRDEWMLGVAEEVSTILESEGFDVLLDDRQIGPGVKFKDADLIGIPIQVIVGRRAKERVVELKVRSSGKRIERSVEQVLEAVRALREELLNE